MKRYHVPPFGAKNVSIALWRMCSRGGSRTEGFAAAAFRRSRLTEGTL